MDAKIYQQFQQIRQRQLPVRLMNVYEGVPISYDATIISLTNNTVGLSVHKYQSVCLRLQKHTYLQSKLMPVVLKASLYTLNLKTNIAILADFQEAHESIGRRSLVRTQPTVALDVFLLNQAKTQRTKTQMVDISTAGIGLTINQLLLNTAIFKVGERVQLQFNLPGIGETIKTEGKIVNLILNKNQQTYRLGLHLYPDEIAKPAIAQFIAQRQNEVLRDIKTIYERLLKEEENQAI